MAEKLPTIQHRFTGSDLPKKLHCERLQDEMDAAIGFHIPLVIRYKGDWVPDAIEMSYEGASREADIRTVLMAHAPAETHREEHERIKRQAAGEALSLKDLVASLQARLEAVEGK